MIGPEKRFLPEMAAETRERRVAAWNEALAKV
jgi:hypothetical protein